MPLVSFSHQWQGRVGSPIFCQGTIGLARVHVRPQHLLLDQLGSYPVLYIIDSTVSRIALTRSFPLRLITWQNHQSRCSLILTAMSTTPSLTMDLSLQDVLPSSTRIPEHARFLDSKTLPTLIWNLSIVYFWNLSFIVFFRPVVNSRDCISRYVVLRYFWKTHGPYRTCLV